MNVAKATFAKKLEVAGARGDRPQVAVAEHVAEPVADLLAQAARAAGRARQGAGPASAHGPDREHEQRRADEAQGVGEDREGRRHRPISPPPIAGPAVWASVRDDLQLAVAVDELVTIDEGRQVRLVGDVEEHGQRPDHEPDDVQLPDRQDAEHVGDRDRSEAWPPGRGRPRSGSDDDAADRPRRPPAG